MNRQADPWRGPKDSIGAPGDPRGEVAALHSDAPRTEARPIDLDAVIGPYLGALTVLLAVLVVALLAIVIVLWQRTGRLSARLHAMTRGSDERSLEAILEAHLERVFAVSRSVDALGTRTQGLERDTRHAVQRVGMVRFNPFEDTGGNQSFALALLDLDGNGVILSSLHARTGTRVYGKAVTAGRADGAVSDEEAAALKAALEPRPVARSSEPVPRS